MLQLTRRATSNDDCFSFSSHVELRQNSEKEKHSEGERLGNGDERGTEARSQLTGMAASTRADILVACCLKPLQTPQNPRCEWIKTALFLPSFHTRNTNRIGLF